MTTTALAVDLGSSSGRVVAGTLAGGVLTETEVHRFPHRAQVVDGYLCWDLAAIAAEVIAGLREAVARFPDARSVSVDSWGVDVVCLDADGRPVAPARAYRDERTTRTLAAFRERLPDARVWEATGIAPATINTANQLFAFRTEEPEAAARVDTVLFLPDHITHLLGGARGWSRSIASTSALCEPGTRTFSSDVFDALELPRTWFGDVTAERTVAGPCTLPGLEQLSVVRAGAHDTACVVEALQRGADVETLFLSCGSWSVLGVLRDDPLHSERALAMGLTNEACAGPGLRPLFNITGLWILQECQRVWREEGQPHEIADLVRQAEASASPGVLFDPDDPQFARPGDMVARVRDAVARGTGSSSGAATSLDQGTLVRVVLESLAARYARGVADLTALTGRAPAQLNLVGGGSRNALLCRLTADAVGVPVVAGPVEAAVLGSLLTQLEVTGALDPVDRNAVIATTARTVTFEPGAAEGTSTRA